MDFPVQYRIPTVAQYQKLRASAGWDAVSDKAVETALSHTLFSVMVWSRIPVGMGRVIGDGALYFYVRGVVVLTVYQGRGTGQLLMTELEKYLEQEARANAFVGLMAAVGTQPFPTVGLSAPAGRRARDVQNYPKARNLVKRDFSGYKYYKRHENTGKFSCANRNSVECGVSENH